KNANKTIYQGPTAKCRIEQNGTINLILEPEQVLARLSERFDPSYDGLLKNHMILKSGISIESARTSHKQFYIESAGHILRDRARDIAELLTFIAYGFINAIAHYEAITDLGGEVNI